MISEHNIIEMFYHSFYKLFLIEFKLNNQVRKVDYFILEYNFDE